MQTVQKSLTSFLKFIIILCLSSPLSGRAKPLAQIPEVLPTVALEFYSESEFKPNLSVSFIEPAQEEQLIQDIAITANQKILIFYAGASDPLLRFVLSNPELLAKTILVDASDLEPAASSAEQSRIWSRLKKLKNMGAGVLVALGTAGVFTAPFYFSSGIETATQIYAMSATVFTLQAVFTQHWQKLLSAGGKVTSSLHGLVRKLLKKDKIEAPQSVVNVGRLMSAFAFNIGTTTAYLNLSGEPSHIWAVLTLASLGVYDITWDLVATRFEELGAISSKMSQRFIRSRILLGALLDSLSIVVGGPVLVAMGALLSSGIVSLFKAPSITKWLQQREKYRAQLKGSLHRLTSVIPALRNRLKSKWPQILKNADPCLPLLVFPFAGSSHW